MDPKFWKPIATSRRKRDDDEDNEKSKKNKTSEKSEDLSGLVKSLFEDNQKLRDDVRNLHNAILAISNSTTDEIFEMKEKIMKLNTDKWNAEQDKKIDNLQTSLLKLESKLDVQMEENSEIKARILHLEREHKQSMGQLEEKVKRAQKDNKLTKSDLNLEISSPRLNVEELKEKILKSKSVEWEKEQERKIGRLQGSLIELESKFTAKTEGISKIKATISQLAMDHERAMAQLEERLKVGEKGLQEARKNLQSTKFELSLQMSTIKNDISNVEAISQKLAEMDKAQQQKMEISEKLICDYKECIVKMESSGEISPIEYKPGPTIDMRFPMLSDDYKVRPTAAELEYRFMCIFCKSDSHNSIDCREHPDFSDRIQELRRQKRCYKCLEETEGDPLKHFPCLKALVACTHCTFDLNNANEKFDFHHPTVCKFNDQSQYRQTRRDQVNRQRYQQGLPPRFFFI